MAAYGTRSGGSNMPSRKRAVNRRVTARSRSGSPRSPAFTASASVAYSDLNGGIRHTLRRIEHAQPEARREQARHGTVEIRLAEKSRFYSVGQRGVFRSEWRHTAHAPADRTCPAGSAP